MLWIAISLLLLLLVLIGIEVLICMRSSQISREEEMKWNAAKSVTEN